MSTSTKKYIFGVRIYLDSVETQDTDIGLYVTSFGDATSQIDITKSGNTVRYTWDGTGTDPNFVDNQMVVGDKVVTNSSTFNAGNNGTFTITAVSNSYFEITNASGVAENNKVLSAATSIQSAYRFRWITNTSTNTTETWKAGMLLEDGIGKLGRGADFSISGNLIEVKGLDITIRNVIGTTPFWKKLSDAGISLADLIAEIVEIDTETAHADTRANEMILWRGACCSPSGWTETKYTIPVKETHYKRIANLTEKVDNDPVNGNYPDADDDAVGKSLPVIFGNFDYAKFIKTSNKITAIDLDDYITTLLPAGMTYFPITNVISSATAPTLSFQFAPGTSGTAGTLSVIKAYLVGKYVKVVAGNGEGDIRKIDNVISVTAGTRGMDIVITVDNYFTKQPYGNDTATATDQSWINILDVKSIYTGDILTLNNFIDSNGVALINGKEEIYAYASESTVSVPAVDTITPVSVSAIGFIRLPTYAFADPTSGASKTNRQLTIQGALFDGDFDKMNAFLVLPIKNPKLLETLSGWGYSYDKIKSGAFKITGSPAVVFAQSIGNIIDKSISTYWYASVTSASGNIGSALIGFSFELPDYPSNFKFDAVYLGLYIDSSLSGTFNQNHEIYGRRFLGNPSITVTKVPSTTPARNIIYNLPDQHFSPIGTSKNLFFYVDRDGVTSSGFKYYTGYSLIPLSDIQNEDIYKSYQNFAYIARPSDNSSQFAMAITIYEMAIVFKKSYSVSEAIYTRVKGRIFNDTWGTRKTAANLMQSPIDIYEHAARLQDWKETNDPADYGKEYSANALINTAATEGGFDWIGLDPIKTQIAARQILDYDECYTDRIMESLSKQYFLCGFQNTAGQECINTIRRISTTPDVALTMNHIIRGSIDSVEEVGPENIFCEPEVNYNFNSASKKYDGHITVSHVDQDTFSAAYVTGFSGDEGTIVWTLCHALYLHYRIKTKPPSEMTDASWIRSKDEAKKYLLSWLEWMGAYTEDGSTALVAVKKRIGFKVPYEIATTIGATHAPWFPSMHFNLTLPHQTNNVTIQGIIEEIEFDLQGQTASVKAILYDVASDIDFYWKNDFVSHASVGWDDVTNSFETKSQTGSQDEDVKNAF